MKLSRHTALFVAAALGALAGPALAGNYGEGDPRPVPLVSANDRATVAADAQQWLKTAPTVGYPQGEPRAVVQVSANSRAMVQAEAELWVRSGLASVTSGEASADLSRPAYRQALAEYNRLRASPDFAALVQRLEGRG